MNLLAHIVNSRSGLLSGDFLVKVDSESVEDFADHRELLAYMKNQVRMANYFSRMSCPVCDKTCCSQRFH